MSDKPLNSACVPRRISRGRRTLFFLTTLFLLLALLEIAVRIGVRLHNRNISLQEILVRQKDVAAPAVADPAGVRTEVIHPYVGYVVDPSTRTGINRYGFLQIDGPILKRSRDQLIVGITGGSVARELCERSAPSLKRYLQEVLGPMEIAIVCLAQEGFHQPQQTMAWSFFQCLGAEFDYLVNLDGFNEVALYQTENPFDDTWYAYPRAWEFRLADTSNPELNRLIASGATMRRKRASMAKRFQAFGWVPLMSLHVLWDILDNSSKRELLAVTASVREMTTASLRQYSHTGPTESFQSDAERIDALVDLWFQCSIAMHRMCIASGTHYLHRLQPNIGIDSFKVLTDAEHYLVSADSPYRPGAKRAYPSLVTRGSTLMANGVDFEDLTAIYSGVAESVYRDDCCHMNQIGNDILARAIAESIGRHFLTTSD